MNRKQGLLATLALLIAAGAQAQERPVEIVPMTPVSGEIKGALPDGRAVTSPGSQPGDTRFNLDALLPAEVEPNNAFGQATPLTLNAGGSAFIQGNIFANGDVDFFSFTAAAGDRIYAAVMTSASANASSDSQLRLLASDGTTEIEFDDDDGSLGGLSSSIAGATIPAAGTYYLRINHFSATNQLRPYGLYLRRATGAPTPEVESNNTSATANVLPASGWVSGARDPAGDADFFSFTANAGDTVFLSLDLDPERDAVGWNGRLGVGLFGDTTNQILVVDDASTLSAANPTSEALFFTVKTAGTYFAYVDSATAGVGGPTATYQLNVSVRPAATGLTCTTYTSTNVPQAIGPGTGLVSSTITVPGNPRIADIDVEIQLNHTRMADIDAHLRSPAGNDNGLFTDIGAAAVGGQAQMNALFDDEAAIPPTFTALNNVVLKPELAYRNAWFDGENGGGTWTLDLYDDTAAEGGTLTGWSIRICEAPPPPTCAAGFGPTTVYTTDFEAGDAGFTSNGTANQWARGLPSAAPITTCNSGTNCFKTNLAGVYSASSNQNLVSPAINLAGLQPPVVVRWAQRYQLESASFDLYSVNAQPVGVPASATRLFQWLDATMTDAPGNPATTINATSGWSQFTGRADALAGQNIELLFNLTSDTSGQFAGAAIDDVSVTACRALSADLSITKTDGVASAVPGTTTTYTIVASNAGPDPVAAATVADTFPAACVSPTWTCVGAGGGTCTANGSGNINQSVNLPAGGSVTFTALCPIASTATGSLANTATVSGGAIADPTPGNNSATDTDTLTPQANLGITKTNGVTQVNAGANTVYTIVASNAGPSAAPGSTVADTAPAACTTFTWSCVGAGGATCPANGSGSINASVNLPVGGTATFSATCAISGAAAGNLVNTATVAVAGGITDPTPANNSATDTDTILASQADVSITKTDGQASDVPGTSISYTIVASNAGPAGAPSVTVADTFAATLTGVTWTCAGAGGGTCTANGAGNINDTANLPNGASVTYTVNATIAANATGTLSNTASATVGGGITDPNAANNSATDTTTLTPQADLAITLTDTPDPVTAGTNLTYVATATNNGPSDATDVAITLPLPANTTLVSATVSGGTCVATTCTFAGATAPGASRSVTYVVLVAASVANGSTITATASASSATTDPNGANNSASTTTNVIAVADLVIGLTSSTAQVLINVPLTFTATSQNLGPSDAQNVSITLTLTPDFRYSSHVATGATCTTPQIGTTGAIVCTWAGSTAPGVTRTLSVVAYSNNEGNTAVNASTTSATTDPVANNNAAALSVVVGFPFNEIPTLSQYGLVLLGLLMGLIGFAAVRRQG